MINHKMKPIYEYGCFVKIVNNVPFVCPMSSDGTADEENWNEIKANENDFLLEINLRLGTNYTEKELNLQ